MDPIGPGTAAYFPSVLSRIREAYPDLPLEPVIVQSILLCLVADDDDASSHILSHASRNLVLRTREEDVSLVLSLTELILTTVFGFPTHKRRVKHHSEATLRSDELHARAREQPEDFLRNLFFRRKHGSRWSAGTGRDGSRRARSVHGTVRSSSYPPPSPVLADNIPLAPSSHSRNGTEDSEIDVTSLGSSRRLFVTPASTLRARPQAPRMWTDPPAVTAMSVAQRLAGHSPKFGARRLESDTNATLLKALAISGLEHVGIPSQRALLQVLHERRLVLDAYESEDGIGRTWNLPDDFIVVYVCPVDSQGRPPVLRTLLDRFAVSVDVSVSAVVRQMYAFHRSNIPTPLQPGTPRTPLSPLRPLDATTETPPTPSTLLRATSQATMRTSTVQQASLPVISSHEIAYLRSLTSQAPPAIPPPHQVGSEMLPDAYTSLHPSLHLYLADLFSAIRHHPLLDGTMLTLRAHRDAEELARAFRVINGSTIGAELVVEVAAMATGDGDGGGSTDAGTDGGLRTPGDADSLEWGKAPEQDEWLEEELRMSKRKASSVRSVEVRVQLPEPSLRDDAPFGEDASIDAGVRTYVPAQRALPPQIWDVSEIDIAKIFPRVVSHRLRMRDGPDDEILGSVMFPAVPIAPQQCIGDSQGDDHVEERTIKQVLISILADV